MNKLEAARAAIVNTRELWDEVEACAWSWTFASDEARHADKMRYPLNSAADVRAAMAYIKETGRKAHALRPVVQLVG